MTCCLGESSIHSLDPQVQLHATPCRTVVQETYRSSDNDEESESEEPSEDEGSKSSWLAAGARVAAAHMAASYDFDGGATDDGWQLVSVHDVLPTIW